MNLLSMSLKQMATGFFKNYENIRILFKKAAAPAINLNTIGK